MLEKCKEMRAELLEELATIDEETRLHDKGTGRSGCLTAEEINAAIRKGVFTNKFNPVLCGSAFKNKGVQQLLDAVINWMPSPLDRGQVKAHI